MLFGPRQVVEAGDEKKKLGLFTPAAAILFTKNRPLSTALPFTDWLCIWNGFGYSNWFDKLKSKEKPFNRNFAPLGVYCCVAERALITAFYILWIETIKTPLAEQMGKMFFLTRIGWDPTAGYHWWHLHQVRFYHAGKHGGVLVLGASQAMGATF